MLKSSRFCSALFLVALLISSLASTTILGEPAYAFEKIEGQQFVANQACPALQSIKKGSNPGNIRLNPEATYEVLGKNRRQASHYMVRIAGARPENRWVRVACGRLQKEGAIATPAPTGSTESTAEPAPTPTPIPTSTPTSTPSSLQTSKDEEFLLALSWQPSFCETRPNKPECRSQTGERFDAKNLVLHGLWPQPRENVYCGVSDRLIKLDKDRRWFELPELDLSPGTRRALATKMPGMASGLDRHEWYKHGTCYSNTAEEYYRESIALLDQVNASAVQDLMESNINFLLTDTEIQQEFEDAFGRAAGEKVAVKCKRDIDEEREIMVVELWLNLKGKIDTNTPISRLLQSAPRARRDCRQGEVDPAGFGNG